VTVAALPRPVRVAIYTRKSVTDGLDQAFNSLDAQRQAIESYVQSQAGLGWTAIATRYDDGGYSGSNTERPAFQALLADVAAGLVDVVAVYKIDRLSRSLRDFAKLIDLFERHHVTFVSVTQQFSTANSMGRLTLNILMSFAEFEREVIGERIRDKVQATRRRGMWTGGRPMLGYDVVEKRLIVNPDEANQVRSTFQLYLDRGSLRETAAELRRRGWHNKTFTTRGNKTTEGRAFTKATLHGLLTNTTYTGQMRCGTDLVAGAHEAIVDAALWEAVQQRLRSNGRSGGVETRNKGGAVLRGLVHCGRCGSVMLHTFSTKNGRRHRYYICSRAHNEGIDKCPQTRVAAGPFEQFITKQIMVMGTDPALLDKTTAAVAKQAADRQEQIAAERRRLDQQGRHQQDDADQVRQLDQRRAEINAEADALARSASNPDALRDALAGFQPIWTQIFPREQERILRLLIERITYHPDDGDVDIDLRPCSIDALAAEAKEKP
jgi:site-specific DNA recombinase